MLKFNFQYNLPILHYLQNRSLFLFLSFNQVTLIDEDINKSSKSDLVFLNPQFHTRVLHHLQPLEVGEISENGKVFHHKYKMVWKYLMLFIVPLKMIIFIFKFIFYYN